MYLLIHRIIFSEGPPTMSMTQVPLYYSMTPSNIIQASNVGPAQNMMVTPATSSAGPVPSTPTQYFYPGVYPGWNTIHLCFDIIIRHLPI